MSRPRKDASWRKIVCSGRHPGGVFVAKVSLNNRLIMAPPRPVAPGRVEPERNGESLLDDTTSVARDCSRSSTFQTLFPARVPERAGRAKILSRARHPGGAFVAKVSLNNRLIMAHSRRSRRADGLRQIDRKLKGNQCLQLVLRFAPESMRGSDWRCRHGRKPKPEAWLARPLRTTDSMGARSGSTGSG